MHLFGDNFTGPGTNLEERLDENDKPLPDSIPVDKIDWLAYYHDLKYRDAGNDLNLKHQADREMIEGLKQLKNLTLKEKFKKAIVLKALQTKVKLGMGLSKNLETPMT